MQLSGMKRTFSLSHWPNFYVDGTTLNLILAMGSDQSSATVKVASLPNLYVATTSQASGETIGYVSSI